MEIKEDKKSRILIFSTAYLPLIGGAELAVKEITDRLGDNFEFDLICVRIDKNLPKREVIGNVEIWRVGRGWGKIDKFFFPWQGFKVARQLYIKNKYDLIWAIMASFGGLAALIFKSQFPGVPYILTLQEGDTPERIYSRAKWLGPFYKKIFQKAELITVISKFLKKFAQKQGARCSMEVIPNGVEIKKFSRLFNEAELKKIKQELNIKENEKIIITISRLVEKNGIGYLIEAIAVLKKNCAKMNYKLLVIGGGELEKSLKKKTEKLKIKENILFLGNIENWKISKYLAIADVFVRPSLAEGLGNSFLEAMAAGVPIVGTPVGGIPDFLKDGETGLFCKVRSAESIAEKILLLSDENLRQKIIKNAKKSVLENYDWDKIALKIGSVFKKMIE